MPRCISKVRVQKSTQTLFFRGQIRLRPIPPPLSTSYGHLLDLKLKTHKHDYILAVHEMMRPKLKTHPRRPNTQSTFLPSQRQHSPPGHHDIISSLKEYTLNIRKNRPIKRRASNLRESCRKKKFIDDWFCPWNHILIRCNSPLNQPFHMYMSLDCVLPSTAFRKWEWRTLLPIEAALV